MEIDSKKKKGKDKGPDQEGGGKLNLPPD